jgi:hypothetical protein
MRAPAPRTRSFLARFLKKRRRQLIPLLAKLREHLRCRFACLGHLPWAQHEEGHEGNDQDL